MIYQEENNFLPRLGIRDFFLCVVTFNFQQAVLLLVIQFAYKGRRYGSYFLNCMAK